MVVLNHPFLSDLPECDQPIAHCNCRQHVAAPAPATAGSIYLVVADAMLPGYLQSSVPDLDFHFSHPDLVSKISCYVSYGSRLDMPNSCGDLRDQVGCRPWNPENTL
jgi:hypothetical protein